MLCGEILLRLGHYERHEQEPDYRGRYGDMNALMDGIIIMICLYAGQIALMWLQSFIMTTVTQSLTKRMRRDISCKVNRLPSDSCELAIS